MADESIVFAVGDDGGTERLRAALQALGITGEASINSVTSALRAYASSSNDSVKAVVAFNAAMRNGVSGADELRTAFDKFLASERQLENANAAAAFQRFQAAAQAAAGATQQAANAVAPLTSNLQSLGAGYLTGTQAAMAHRAQTAQTSAAWQTAYGAATSLKNGIAGFAQASASSLGAFGQLTQAVLGYASAAKVINSVDIAENVTRQIAALVPNVQEADRVFNQLADTAVKTQLPLESVSQGFSQIYAAIKGNGGTTEQATLAIDNLSRVFKATGVQAQAIPRILHDISEGLAAGTLGGQQLRSLLMQAGASLPLLDQALGGNIRALSSHASAVDKAKERVSELRSEIDHANPSVGTSRQEVEKWTGKISESQREIEKLNTKLRDNTYTAKQHEEQQRQLTRVTSEYNKELPSLQANLDRAKGKFSEATAAVDAKKRADLAGAEAALKHSTALDSESILAGLTGQKFTQAAHDLNLGVGTIGGAFTALTTQFEVYLKQSGDADTITKSFSIVLGLIGQNLNTIVPLVAGLAAAWTTYRIAATAAAAVTAILEAEYAPFIALGLALAAAVLALTGHFGVFTKIIDTLYTAIRGNTKAVDENKDALDTNTKSVVGTTDATGRLASSQYSVATSASSASTAITNMGTSATDASQTAANSASGWAGLIRTILAGIDAIVAGWEKVKAVASSVLGGGGGSGAAAPGSRDGSSFVVAGSSGVDSKLIAVSPGERVTIQTPMQAKTGEIPKGVPKFRDGGVYDTSQYSASFNAANDNQSVTGYKTPGEYYTNSDGAIYSAASLRAVAAAEAAQKAAEGAQTAAVTTQALAQATVATNSLSGSKDNIASTASTSASNSERFDRVAYNSAVAAWNKRVSDNIRNFTSIGGVSKPSVDGTNWSIEQTHIYTTDGQKIGLNAGGGFFDGKGGTKSVYGELQSEAKQNAGKYPVYNDFIKARDGMNYTVGGSSGVDSKVIQLAVSPGENVQVKTPAQQRADAEAETRVGGGTKIINFNVSTPDSNSFRKSDRQIQSDLKRAMARVR